MWSIAVLAVMMALSGVYLNINKEQEATNDRALATTLAASMATYRTAVSDYFRLNPAVYQSVDIDTLKASGVLPTWSTLYTQSGSVKWANYRDTNGLVYIYAATAPEVNITVEVARLSQNSILTGVYRTGDTTLYSPAFGQTQVPLPLSAAVSIPNGSPLWVVTRK